MSDRRRRRAPFRVGAVAVLAVLLFGAGPPASPPAVPAEVTATPPLTAVRPAHLHIPAIAVDSPLVDLGLLADGTLQVPGGRRRGATRGWPACVHHH
jgi:hypothetical protein